MCAIARRWSPQPLAGAAPKGKYKEFFICAVRRLRPRQVTALHPQLRQASLANQQLRWQQAEAIARQYLGSSPGDPLAMTILGEALLGMRRAVDAETALRAAIATNPHSVPARLALSRSLEMQCRIDEAVELLDGVLGEQPDSPEVWEYLAQLLGRARRFARAIEAHEQVLRFGAGNPRLWLEYAIALRFAGRQPDALRALRRALELEPSYGPGWWVMTSIAPDAVAPADLELIESAL
jgi:predicted Zn-dependent protease